MAFCRSAATGTEEVAQPALPNDRLLTNPFPALPSSPYVPESSRAMALCRPAATGTEEVAQPALLRIFFLARLFARPLRSRFCWSSAVKFHGSSAPSAVLRVLGCSVRQPKSSPHDLIARLSGGPLSHPPFSLSSSLSPAARLSPKLPYVSVCLYTLSTSVGAAKARHCGREGWLQLRARLATSRGPPSQRVLSGGWRLRLGRPARQSISARRGKPHAMSWRPKRKNDFGHQSKQSATGATSGGGAAEKFPSGG